MYFRKTEYKVIPLFLNNNLLTEYSVRSFNFLKKRYLRIPFLNRIWSMESKSALRRIVRDRGELYDGRTRAAMSQRVMEAVGRFPPFADAASVALYWSLPAEVDTHAFVEKWAVRKKVYLPVMRGDGLSLRKFTGRNELREARFGIREPVGGGRDLPAADRPDRGSGHGVRSVRKPSRARQRILRSVADARSDR